MSFDDFPDDLEKEKSLREDEKEEDFSSENKNKDEHLDLESLEVTEHNDDFPPKDNPPFEDEEINNDIDFKSLEETSQEDLPFISETKSEDSFIKYGEEEGNDTGLKLKTKNKDNLALKKKSKKTKGGQDFVYKDGSWKPSDQEFDSQTRSKITKIEMGKTAITGIIDDKEESLKIKTDFSKAEKSLNRDNTFGTIPPFERTKAEKSKIDVHARFDDETFLETSIGQAMLVVKSGVLKKKVFSLQKKTLILGRSNEADITLPDPRSSRKHAKIYFSEGNFIAEDLGSANGIKVNGNRVSRYLLQSQDRISIGNTILEFVLVDPKNFEKPDDVSIVMNYDSDSATEMEPAGTGYNTTGIKSLGGRSIQNAKTEVVGKDSLEESKLETGIDFALLEQSYGDFEANKFSRKYFRSKGVEKPVSVSKLLKPFFTIFVVLVFVFSLLIIYLMSGGRESGKKTHPEVKEASLPEKTVTGLTPAEETLAVRHYENAKNYYDRQEYQNAITEATRAINVYPGFSQASEIIAYSKAAIKEMEERAQLEVDRGEQEKLFSQMEGFLNEADKLLISKNFRAALVPINKVLDIDANHEEAVAMLEEANNGIRAQTRAAISRNNRIRLMQTRFDQANRFYGSGDYITALKTFRSVMAMGRRTNPGVYDQAQKLSAISQRKVLDNFSSSINEAKSSMKILDFSSAVKILDDVIKKYPEHPEASSLRKLAYEELTLQVRKIYQKALVIESINDLEEATEEYQKILKLAPKDHEYYKKALGKIKKYN